MVNKTKITIEGLFRNLKIEECEKIEEEMKLLYRDSRDIRKVIEIEKDKLTSATLKELKWRQAGKTLCGMILAEKIRDYLDGKYKPPIIKTERDMTPMPLCQFCETISCICMDIADLEIQR